MKICSVADVHINQNGQAHDRPLITTPEADVLTVSGDLTIGGTIEQLVAFRQWLVAQPQKHKVVIAGNHDFCFEDKRSFEAQTIIGGPGITYLQDQETTIDGVRFYGSPWQPWWHDWAFNLLRGQEIAKKWAMIPEGIDVLLVHGPPHGYGDTVVRGERVGCEELTRAIDKKKPKVVCFGHIHEDTGVWKRNDSVLVNCSIGYRVGHRDLASREPFVFEIVDRVVKY